MPHPALRTAIPHVGPVLLKGLATVLAWPREESRLSSSHLQWQPSPPAERNAGSALLVPAVSPDVSVSHRVATLADILRRMMPLGMG